MTEQVATIEDYRLCGARFGIECAQAAKRKRAAGESREQIRAHVVGGMVPAKDAQLREIGATDAEIGSFMRAAGAASYAALNGVDLLGILNRRRRALRRPAPGHPRTFQRL